MRRGRARYRICSEAESVILKLRNEGYSYRQIAERVGVSYVTCWRKCRFMDIIKTINDKKKLSIL